MMFMNFKKLRFALIQFVSLSILLGLMSLLLSPEAHAQVIAIQGTVTDRETGLPVAGVVVNTDGGKTTTDGAGQYTFTLDQFRQDRIAFYIYADQYFNYAEGTTTLEAPFPITVDHVLVPAPESILQGRVLDTSGNPVEGAEVGHNFGYSTTDSAGFFSVPGSKVSDRYEAGFDVSIREVEKAGFLSAYVNLNAQASPPFPFPYVVEDIQIQCASNCSAGDQDNDGVDDNLDLCTDTNSSTSVDSNGCSDVQVDADSDGICNTGAVSNGPSSCSGVDNCPNTALGDTVGVNGCSYVQLDHDSDGTPTQAFFQYVDLGSGKNLTALTGNTSRYWQTGLTTSAGYSGNSYLKAVGWNVTPSNDVGTVVDIPLEGLPSGNYYIYVHVKAETDSDDSVWGFIDSRYPKSGEDTYITTRGSFYWQYLRDSGGEIRTFTPEDLNAYLAVREFDTEVSAYVIVSADETAAPSGLDGYYTETTKKPDITVMTQNQYLGTSLVPLISAINAEYSNDPFGILKKAQAINGALILALDNIVSSNAPERITALAESIDDKKPHLVGLQEVASIQCSEIIPGSGACSLLGNEPSPFNDHLALTLAALPDYSMGATVENTSLEFPIDLDGNGVPDALVSVLDRDVILARNDIEVEPIHFPCTERRSVDGCNFEFSSVPLVKRGFVGVHAMVKDADYMFVNTHLEIEGAPQIQALQSAELLHFVEALNSDWREIIVGDINSSPDNPYEFPLSDNPVEFILDPYRQLENKGFTDIWPLRPEDSAGYTCCQASDLANPESQHSRRIDVIFAKEPPKRVEANVLDDQPLDTTESSLWPSDHSSVSGSLYY